MTPPVELQRPKSRLRPRWPEVRDLKQLAFTSLYVQFQHAAWRRQQEHHFFRTIRRSVSWIGLYAKSGVPTAGGSLRAEGRMQGSADGNAPYLSTLSPSVVFVDESQQRHDVYNITVENGEYFANGILTHNCDELAKWKNLTKRDTEGGTAWSNLLMGLRIGPNPQVVITTTPRPLPLIKEILNLLKNLL